MAISTGRHAVHPSTPQAIFNDCCAPPLLYSQIRVAHSPLASDLPGFHDELHHHCQMGPRDIDNALSRIDQPGDVPSDRFYVSLLKACKQWKALDQARRIHVHVTRHRLELTDYLGDFLVVTFAKCGSFTDAWNIFCSLSHRSIFSWTSMISACADSGHGREALEMHEHMQEDGIEPNSYALVSLLKACGSVADVEHGRRLHMDTERKGLFSDIFVGSSLLTMYGKCGSIVEAEVVFSSLSQRDLVIWSALLSSYVDQGMGAKALLLYRQMQEEGMPIDGQVLVITLHACGDLAWEGRADVAVGQSGELSSFEIGQSLHGLARRKGYVSDVFVCSSLLSMYGKCGTVMEAENMIESLHQCNDVSWNTLLSLQIGHCQAEKVLQLFRQMQEEGLVPNHVTFVSAFQACSILAEREEVCSGEGQLGKIIALEIGQALRVDAQRMDAIQDGFVGSTLVSMYGKCGAIVEAENVFKGLSLHDVVSWNAMISAYVEYGEGKKALQLYRQMLEQTLGPNRLTFVSTLQACTILAEQAEVVFDCLEIGQGLHKAAQKKGFTLDVCLGSTLIRMYATCGTLMEADIVFDSFYQHDEVMWNALLLAYVLQDQGSKALQFYKLMQLEGIIPSKQAFMSAAQACSIIAEKEQTPFERQGADVVCGHIALALSADAHKNGFAKDVFVGSTLVSMHGKCGLIPEAESVFEGLYTRNEVSWNAMMSAYVKQGQAVNALKLFRQLQEEGLRLNHLTFVISLQACGMLTEQEEAIVEYRLFRDVSLEIGQALHADARKVGFGSDLFISSTLVSMYGKCGSPVNAENVFCGLMQDDSVSWCALVSAYAESGQGDAALQLYGQMLEEGVSANNQTYAVSILACGVLAENEKAVALEGGQCVKQVSLEIGQALHSDAQKKGFFLDMYVGNTLVSMYGKCGDIREAERVFISLFHRSVVSWTAMLSVYVEHGQGENAMLLYRQMEEEGMSPSPQTLVITLQACGSLVDQETVRGQPARAISLSISKALHVVAQRKGFSSDAFVGNALVSIYSKLGEIVEAESIFGVLSQRSVVSWSAMLSAYVERDEGSKAMQFYHQMQKDGAPSDEVTCVIVLQACSKAGSLEMCQQIHFGVLFGGYDEDSLVINTLIHTYGSCASMVDAQVVFDVVLYPDRVSWNAYIAGHAQQGNCIASWQAFEEMQLADIKPDEITFLSTLFACSHAGLVNQGIIYFVIMNNGSGLTPAIKHYASMIDLFGRAGDFEGMKSVLSEMPMQPDLATWLSLLGVCKLHVNVEIGKQAFMHAVRSHPKEAAPYVLMSNIITDSGLQQLEIDIDTLLQEDSWFSWTEDTLPSCF